MHRKREYGSIYKKDAGLIAESKTADAREKEGGASAGEEDDLM
jgi:hypothetical protein